MLACNVKNLEFATYVQVYKLPADRFYATYFGGDEEAGIPPDTESRDIWLRYLPDEIVEGRVVKTRVLPFGCKVVYY
jgi:alanyl-tRNA synthetase